MIDIDRIRGTILGHAIGDALGVPAEYKSSARLTELFPPSLDETAYPHTYIPVSRKVFGIQEDFAAGEYSDDTEMALCIVEGFLENPEWPLDPIARRFRSWLDTNQKGAGGTIRAVVGDPNYLKDPTGTALRAWEKAERNLASNGAVMRSAVVGLLLPWKRRDHTEWLATDIARITHFDPRCAASSIAVSVAVASLVTGGSIDDAVQDAIQHAKSFDDIEEWLTVKSLEDLKLDEGLPGGAPGPVVNVGFTYKTLGVAFWGLRNMENIFTASGLRGGTTAEKFHYTLVQIIRAGGDTDTNSAVAGALMGARYGAALALPQHLVQGLVGREYLETVVTRLAGRGKWVSGTI